MGRKIFIGCLLLTAGVLAGPAGAEVRESGQLKYYVDEIPSGWNIIDFSRPNDVTIDEYGDIYVPTGSDHAVSSLAQPYSDQSRTPPPIPLEQLPSVTIFNGTTDLGDNGIWNNQRNGYLHTAAPRALRFLFDEPVYGFGVLVNSYQSGEALQYVFMAFGGHDIFWSYRDNQLEPRENNQGTLIGVETSRPVGFTGFEILPSSQLVVDNFMFTHTVVPEPVSSVLMLIGGGAMVLRRRFDQKFSQTSCYPHKNQ